MENLQGDYGALKRQVVGRAEESQDDARCPGTGGRSYKSLILLTGLLALVLFASVYLEKVSPSRVPVGGCDDGTPQNKCSESQPFYCMNGELVERASLCGCPENYSIRGRSCVRVLRCEDGTVYGRCSAKKPMYCEKGALVSKASVCGCPEGSAVRGDSCEKLKKCRDGTLYSECSSEKPLYCRDGRLVNDSATCGCPEGYIVMEDSCVYPYEGNPKERIFPYTVKNRTSAIRMAVHQGLKNYLAALPRIYYCDPTCPTPRELEMRYLEDAKQKPELLALVEKIKARASNPEDQARIAISLVQNIPYDTERAETGNLTNRYPYEVLYDQKGVCGEKSRLLAFILRELGYAVYLLDYEKEDHMAVALRCPIEYAQYSYNSTGYCFLETTRVSILTDNTGRYSSSGEKLESIPSLLIVSDEGMDFPAEDEYRDAQDWAALNERAASAGGTLGKEDYERWKEIKEKYGIPTFRADRAV